MCTENKPEHRLSPRGKRVDILRRVHNIRVNAAAIAQISWRAREDSPEGRDLEETRFRRAKRAESTKKTELQLDTLNFSDQFPGGGANSEQRRNRWTPKRSRV